MSDPLVPRDRGEPCDKRTTWISLGLLVGLCLWAAYRLGAFDLMATVTVNGESISVPNVFAEVDHPFHATRAYTLLESLRDGELLRWVGNHQGGYPVEFYPLGIAWFDVILWALFLGMLPIIALHKLTIVAVFLLPAFAFWLLARGDRMHPGVVVLATAVHFAVPGHWLNGGYTELVEWGLVTNVAGASLAMVASVALARYVLHREHGMGVLALLAAAAGAVTNPRSLFALVIAAIAILIANLVSGKRDEIRQRGQEAIVRISIVGGLAALLAAPVILALFRYNSHYFFLHYQFYDPLSQFWDAAVSAVTIVVLLLALAGVIVPFAMRGMSISRAMAIALGLYVLFTMWVATADRVPPLVEQLEAPRLMPYQRQLMIWFGTVTVWAVLRRLGRAYDDRRRDIVPAIGFGALSLLVLVILVRPLGFVPANYHGMFDVTTTGNEDFAYYQLAIRESEELREPGTSMFVVGNRNDWWHHQLWAPTESDTPFYYDDWMWYWTTTHQGPYDYRNGHYFPSPAEALTQEYFAYNGISVVLVTDTFVPYGIPPREAARDVEALEFDRTVGAWDVYRVREPTSMITNGDVLPSEIEVSNHRLTASFEAGDGNIVIRRNWFPRWDVKVNGESASITQRGDGYMEVNVPPGAVDVDVRYTVTRMDWTGRIASVLGALGVVAFAVRGREWIKNI